MRMRWLARLTRGRWGAGRWSEAEVQAIRQRAREMHAETLKYTD